LINCKNQLRFYVNQTKGNRVEIIQEKQGNVNVIKVKGRLDASTAAKLEETLELFVNEDRTRILVDCETLDYISSAGLRVLLASAKELKKTNGKIYLSSLNPNVKQVFEISGFTTIFPIYESIKDALADLSV